MPSKHVQVTARVTLHRPDYFPVAQLGKRKQALKFPIGIWVIGGVHDAINEIRTAAQRTWTVRLGFLVFHW